MPRTVYDNRQDWLKRLVEAHGGVERFAELTHRNPKHVSAMKGGKKRMGSSVARDIEARLASAPGLKPQPGQMDADPRADIVSGDLLIEVKGAPASQAGRIDLPTLQRSMTMLVRLSRSMGFELDPAGDLDLVVRVYELAMESDGSFSGDNVVVITEWLQARRQEKTGGTSDQGNRRTGSGAAGEARPKKATGRA